MEASTTPPAKRPFKMHGPVVPYSEELHAQKYRGIGENFREYGNRVANALKDDEDHFHVFRELLLDQRYLPGGRIQSAMGATKTVTAYNCFVSGIIEDSLVEGGGNIHWRLGESWRTMRMGGGIGYDWSTLRPRGSAIKKLQSRTNGPIPWMKVYDAGARGIASAGHRRGAQMGVMRVDHPDVLEFVMAKQNRTELTSMNLSVAITDAFMDALHGGKTFQLRWGGQDHNEIDAAELWDAIMRSTYDWAEPGVLFIDQINRMNNLWYCETITATNPCGEQPLPPFGACLLGSFNLIKYLIPDGKDGWAFDLARFKADIPPVVRAMDNVVDRTIYPLHEQEAEAQSKRRMGIGVCGLANAIETMGHSYGSPTFLEVEELILRTLKEECYRASAMLAKEKKPFPKFDATKYLAGEFIKTLPDDIRDLIAKHGIRNSHLTSIAPTGTISTAADNVSGGIEPVFKNQVQRTVIEFDGERHEVLMDCAYRVYGTKGKEADDCTVAEHLGALLTAQRQVDSAVSKTCNVATDIPWEDFKGVYLAAHAGGAKGCTTYRQHEAGRGSVLTAAPAVSEEEGLACTIVNGQKTCE
jgi:ribonucleoside-diphosphate reductase alpha chain